MKHHLPINVIISANIVENLIDMYSAIAGVIGVWIVIIWVIIIKNLSDWLDVFWRNRGTQVHNPPNHTNS